MATDEQGARERFTERMREHGMSKSQAERQAERTYERVARKYDADQQHNTHRDVRPKR